MEQCASNSSITRSVDRAACGKKKNRGRVIAPLGEVAMSVSKLEYFLKELTNISICVMRESKYSAKHRRKSVFERSNVREFASCAIRY